MADDFTLGEQDGFVATGVDLGAGEDEGWSESGLDPLDDEADPFIGKAVRWARRRVRKLAPVLRRLAPIAARVALGPAGGPAAAMLGGLTREDEFESEWEDESLWEAFDPFDDEDEAEDESEAVTGLDTEAEALAEAFAALAGETESEDEASGLMGGVTIQILAPSPIRIRRLAPAFVQRATRLTRLLRRSPATRALTPVVPAIVRRASGALARGAAAGRPVSAAAVGRAMAAQTARTLGSPKRVAGALARNVIRRRRLAGRRLVRVER
jgi:hypothetical protein